MLNLSSLLGPLVFYKRKRLVIRIYSPWLEKNKKTLDIGCGDGILSQTLAEKFHFDMSGCDIENYVQTPIHFKLMKHKNRLPYNNESFAFVFLNDVLHHTDHQTQMDLLQEALRVSQKGVLIFELKPTIGAYLGDFISNKIYHPAMKVPFKFRSFSEWKSIFRDLKVEYEAKELPRPLYSPFSHLAFFLKKK